MRRNYGKGLTRGERREWNRQTDRILARKVARPAKLRLVESRTHYCHDESHPAGGYYMDNPEFARVKVGDEVCHDVAAPGYGRRVYRITAIDAKGAWGILVKDTVGELTEGMVR